VGESLKRALKGIETKVSVRGRHPAKVPFWNSGRPSLHASLWEHEITSPSFLAVSVAILLLRQSAVTKTTLLRVSSSINPHYHHSFHQPAETATTPIPALPTTVKPHEKDTHKSLLLISKRN
jgi:hypothetical protein